jgi:hypothetical protein
MRKHRILGARDCWALFALAPGRSRPAGSQSADRKTANDKGPLSVVPDDRFPVKEDPDLSGDLGPLHDGAAHRFLPKNDRVGV